MNWTQLSLFGLTTCDESWSYGPSGTSFNPSLVPVCIVGSKCVNSASFGLYLLRKFTSQDLGKNSVSLSSGNFICRIEFAFLRSRDSLGKQCMSKERPKPYSKYLQVQRILCERARETKRNNTVREQCPSWLVTPLPAQAQLMPTQVLFGGKVWWWIFQHFNKISCNANIWCNYNVTVNQNFQLPSH